MYFGDSDGEPKIAYLFEPIEDFVNRAIGDFDDVSKEVTFELHTR